MEVFRLTRLETLESPKTVGFVRGLRYRSSEELRIDLEKLLGLRNFEAEVPELIETRSENIQVSDDAPAIYTSRVRAIVDHPLVRRLGAASQLGLVSLVYPGATHSRLEHALGTFGVAARYIRALSNDNLDPLFRQIMSAQDVKATLLAALLHDVGQYPLAHDLEDVSSEFFSHETFGAQLLSTAAQSSPRFPCSMNSESIRLTWLRSSPQLLEEEWGVPLQAVRAIINARSSEREKPAQRGSHTERLCKSLIDGPIDADKVDYLRRDSQHCNVQYGRGIDLVVDFRNPYTVSWIRVCAYNKVVSPTALGGSRCLDQSRSINPSLRRRRSRKLAGLHDNERHPAPRFTGQRWSWSCRSIRTSRTRSLPRELGSTRER